MPRRKSINISKGTLKHLALQIPQIGGLNTAQNPLVLGDTAMQWLEGLPAIGTIANVPVDSLKYEGSIKYAQGFILNYARYHAVIEENVLKFLGPSPSFDVIASIELPGSIRSVSIAIQTTSGNTYAFVTGRGGGERFLIAFDGSSIIDLSSLNVAGDAICSWKGRIYLGFNDTILYSIPNPNPLNPSSMFDTNLGAGFFAITVSSFSRIVALVPKQDIIYVFTDRSIVGLIGTTVSNDPTTWYIQERVKEVGCLDTQSIITTKENVTYFMSAYGIYKFITTQATKVDYAIANVALGKMISSFVWNGLEFIACYGRKHLSSDYCLYCYLPVADSYYALSMPNNVSSMYSMDGALYYSISEGANAGLYQLFGGTSYRKLMLKTKVYVAPGASVHKNIKGVNLLCKGIDIPDCYIESDADMAKKLMPIRDSVTIAEHIMCNVFGNETGSLVFGNQYGSLVTTNQIAITGLRSTRYAGDDAGLSIRCTMFNLLIVSRGTSKLEIASIDINGWMGAIA